MTPDIDDALAALNLLVSNLWPRLSTAQATLVRLAFERAFAERERIRRAS